MKSLAGLLALALAFTVTASAATRPGWMDNLEKAKAQAKAEHKQVLLDFTGSDWCPWCMKLEKEVFSQSEFKNFAAKNYVLVEVDFPQGFELPAATKKQNELLSKKYRVDSFPTVVVTSPEGTKKGEIGYLPGGPKAFIHELQKVK